MNFGKQVLCIPLLLCTILFQPAAQTRQVRFANIGLRDGLSNASVSSFVQDAAGFIWIGTQGGLHRWDGKEFTLYENEPFNRQSLPHNLIQTMYMDPDGETIWIGTYRGLVRFDTRNQHFTSWSRNLDNPSSLSNDVVVSISKDAQNRLWVGTLDGLNRMDGDSFVRYPVEPDNPDSLANRVIRAVTLDSRGTLWIGTSGGGLHRYNDAEDNFERIPVDPHGTQGTGSEYIMSISESADGLLWLGQWFFGISAYDPETGTYTHYRLEDNRVYFVNARDPGRVYAGTWGGGLFELDTASGTIHRYERKEQMWSLPHNTVYSCLVDSAGEVWIGTNGGGFSHLLRESQAYTRFEHDPSDPGSRASGKTNAVLEDSKGRLWIGTYNGGLSRLDPGKTAFRHYRHNPADPRSLANDIITVLKEDTQGAILVATQGGLHLWDEKTDSFKRILHNPSDPYSLPDNIVYELLEEPDTGNFWVGMYHKGVAYWDRTTGRFTGYPSEADNPETLSDNLVYSMARDRHGHLWVGTNSGLNRHLGNGRFVRYMSDPDNRHSIPSNTIMRIYLDTTGNLWLGTNGGGVARYNEETDTFTTWTKREGLPSNVLTGLLSGPQGSLWAATSMGLAVYDPATDLFTPFAGQEGLRYSEFNGGHYRNSQGQLYFGVLNALYRIDPTLVSHPDGRLPLRLTGITVLNQPLETTVSPWFIDRVVLPWNRNSISFTFSALDFRDPGRNQYAYKLEGFDTEWIYSGNRSYASYTNLRGGRTYQFRVRVSSPGGSWDGDALTIPVRLSRAPWLRWWAFVLYILFLAGLLWISLVIRSRLLLREQVSELTRVKGELELANIQLGIIADHDGLTGLRNRRSIDAELHRRYEAAAAFSEPISVMMIDIDKFKDYNDHYGHQLGDEALIRVAGAIARAMDRPQDSVGRYGGEEFLVVLPGTDTTGARMVAERICAQVRDLAIPHEASNVLNVVTLSAGLATAIPSAGASFADLVKLADTRLYRAKHEGRNRIIDG